MMIFFNGTRKRRVGGFKLDYRYNGRGRNLVSGGIATVRAYNCLFFGVLRSIRRYNLIFRIFSIIFLERIDSVLSECRKIV